MQDPSALGVLPISDLMDGLHTEVLSERDPTGNGVERLLETIERHAEAESDALAQYEYLGSASEDAVIALVMRLILDDEVRHHALLRRIATSLRDALYWTHSPDALPRSGVRNDPPAPELAAIAQGLIEEEKAGAEALRRIASREKRLDSGLDSLLLEMMAMDSEKHAHLLRFVERRLHARARSR